MTGCEFDYHDRLPFTSDRQCVKTVTCEVPSI